jgi:hypothetical protein
MLSCIGLGDFFCGGDVGLGAAAGTVELLLGWSMGDDGEPPTTSAIAAARAAETTDEGLAAGGSDGVGVVGSLTTDERAARFFCAAETGLSGASAFTRRTDE